jgi:hypothetical protein
VFCEGRKKFIEIEKDLDKEARWRIKFWSFKISLSYIFKKPNNSILTLQQVEFLVNLELNWWGIMTTPQWKISRKDSCSFCPTYRNARHRSQFD